MQIGVEMEPLDCFDNSCRWESDDKSIAEARAYSDGCSYITANSVGTCVVTCVANVGRAYASCQVEVVE